MRRAWNVWENLVAEWMFIFCPTCPQSANYFSPEFFHYSTSCEQGNEQVIPLFIIEPLANQRNVLTYFFIFIKGGFYLFIRVHGGGVVPATQFLTD